MKEIRFKARVSNTFREDMIRHWMNEDEITREKAIRCYVDKRFEQLVNRIQGKVATFISISGIIVEEDDNFILIPIQVLTKMED